MVKPLLLVAIVANLFMLVLSTGKQQPRYIGPPAPCPPQKPPSCRTNEIWSSCPIAVCAPKTCNDVGYPVACPDFLPNGKCPVPPGCICREGYVRSHETMGICIPMKHCPSCGGDRNAVSGCGTNCNRMCSNYNKRPADACTMECLYNGCDCRPGLVFDEVTGKCVFPSQCTLLTCNVKHEIYDPCPATCPFHTCGINDALLDCVAPLRPGDPNCPPPKCRCRDGYYRNDVGQCVLWEQCPVCSGINEMYDPCPATCPPQRCDVNIALILCALPPKLGDPECQPGCRCIDDHVRNHAGVCIPRDQCPTCPNINEVYDPCIAPCPPRRCDVDERLIKCAAPPKIGDEDCVAGCRCADGYYRNSLGICVTRAECPSCDGPHEYYACGGACDNVCATLHERSQNNCPIVNIRCNDMCYCEEGYARDANNNCIPIEECPVPKCKCKHEVFSECIQGDCRPKTCTEVGFPVACPRIDPKYCKRGCICEDGYVRADNGKCIPKDQCPSCGGDCNAVSGCGVHCNNRCSDIGKEPGFCIEICYENACDCKPGYAYDDNTQKCVHPDKCTPTCGPDEIYSDCIQNDCNPQNCSQLGYPIDCKEVDPKCCKAGCLCKVGFVRNCKGVCIPAKECPSCGGDPNAESGCGKNCGRLCSNYMQKGVVCTLECQINGCNCKKDYVYDTNTKKCVLPKECTSVCKKNEVYSECTNGGCSRTNCSQIGFPVPCKKIDHKDCIKGCLCKKGFLREDNGECVPEKDCKPTCNKPNEYYEPCAYDCPPNTCESLDRLYKCPSQNKDNCKGKCKCKKGYYRNKKGECITEKQCRKCMDPHEYFSCGGACDNVCATIKKQNQTNCPIVNIKCNEMCYCEDDYARAKNGTCIPMKDCNKPQCKKNEVYSKCPAWTCKPKACCDVGYPVPCPFIPADAKCPDKPACVCVDGYVKDDNDECIPVKECPTCGGDENAELGCGTNCGKKCEDLGNEPGACPEICGINTCDCKDGYYYDKSKDKCVLPSECTGICSGKNEVFEDCTNPTCRPKKCSEVGFPLNCTYVPECNKGCVCKEGYVKNAEEVCIPIKQCLSCGGDKNAQSGCGVNCLKKCYDFQNPDKPKPCPKICRVNACDCKDGYYYDENTKKCVRSKKCTPTCGKDEVFDPCTNGGCTMKNCTQLGGPMPTKNPKKCIAGCSCKEGYLRSSEGVCIPAEKCPKAKCKKNEKFSLCPSSFCGPQRCDQLGYPIKCPVIKDGCCPSAPGCICEDDYVKNDKGKCIPKRSCPSCGGDKNAWAGCGINCGKHCDDINNKTRVCLKICLENSCDCKDGFYYDETERQCVEPDCCTPPCPENEVRDSCVNGGCGYRNCSELNGPILCIDPIKCKAGCTCKEDYLRDDDTGICVPKDKCPKICDKPNEEYVKCPPSCPPQTCESLNKKYHCPLIKTKIDESDCVGECRCIEGYYRNLKGECISEENCLRCKGKHTYFSCGPACDNVCCDLDKQSKDNCPINNKKCVEMCYCEDGYARDDDDNCVPIEDCGNEDDDPDCPDSINSTVAVANFQYGNAKLTFELMKEYQVTRKNENVMFSTLSLLIALAKLTLGAIGDSLKQLLNIQNLKCKEEIRVVYPIIIESLTNPQNVTFEIGNKDYADINNCPLTEQYKKDAIEVFFSEADNIDFSQNVKASNTINKWVSNRTRGLITDLVKPEMFSSLTRLAIFNVLYFLGNWKYPFDEKKTKPAKFFLNDKDSVMLPTMNQMNRFKYGESDCLDAKIIILPYEGAQFTLVIILPNKITGLKSMLANLDVDTFKESMDSLTLERCNVSIPLMDFKNDFSDLKTSLGKLGLTAPFEPNSDDFRGIIQNNEPLSITDLIQKTVYKMNEKGTKAAAATGVILTGRSLQRPSTIYNFDANCPFMFLLQFADTIVLSGAFNG